MSESCDHYSIKELIKGDLCRHTDSNSFYSFFRAFRKRKSFKYMFWFRLTQSSNWFIRKYAKARHARLSRLYGIQIPKTTKIAPGFYIGHHMGVVINSSTRIGVNCNISQFTTIGSNHDSAAEIGDNVYIGPHVCIIENVKIGNNATVGAGSVVVKDVPENATVAGNPAKVISMNEPGRYIKNRYCSED